LSSVSEIEREQTSSGQPQTSEVGGRAVPASPHDRHLWQIVWVRDLVWLGLAAVVLLAAYRTRAIIVPILIGLGLAYVFNPFITWMERRHRWPRWASTAAVLVVTYGMLTVAVMATAPPIIAQSRQLVQRVGAYAHVLTERIEAAIQEAEKEAAEQEEATREASVGGDTDAAIEQNADTATADGTGQVVDEEASENAAATVDEEPQGLPQEPSARRTLFASASQRLANLDFAAVADFVVKSLDVGVGVVGSVVSFTTYLVLSAVVITLCFFFFSWKFGPIQAWFGSFIPPDRRERTLHILGRMDESISAFIRGRLIQSVIMTMLLSIGWWAVGVRYWLLLGVVTGLLNLIPYAGVIGFLTAVGLAAVDQLTGSTFSWFVPIGAAVVYLIAQTVDGWVVEPLVQGKATDLDPLTILLVVLIGGSLAGLLGLILAIPVAACVKILSQEVLLPRLRARL